jgi:plasmid maintenance system antidote protein VapI
MATLDTTTNTFVSWNLEEQEELSGSILTDLQVKKIQTELCRIAESKLNLKVDPANINQFIQDESFISGQMAILRHLLDVSEAAIQLSQELNSKEGN